MRVEPSQTGEPPRQIDTTIVRDEENDIDGEAQAVVDSGPNGHRESVMANVDKFRDGPWFTQTDFVKDACERRPDHPDYDPTTLYIPPEEWAAIKPGMLSFWKAKCKNFDTIIFFRFGPWFNVYFQDLAICSRYFDLHVPEWQPSTNTGFHEVHVNKHIQILVNAGYKVAICE